MMLDEISILITKSDEKIEGKDNEKITKHLTLRFEGQL